MKFFVLVMLMQVLTISSARADEQSLIQTKDKTALDLERIVVEQNIKSKILGVVVPLIPDTRFNLDVVINYKIVEKPKNGAPTVEDGTGVELGKLGVVAPSMSDELLHKDLVQNIGFIRITFIFYDHVTKEQLDLLNASIKKVVDIVPVWRLRIETVVPPMKSTPTPAPKPSFSSEFGFGNVWMFLVGLGVIGLLFAFWRVTRELVAVREALKGMRGESRGPQAHPQHDGPVREPVYEREAFAAEEAPIESEVVSEVVEPENAKPVSIGLAGHEHEVTKAMEYLARSTPEDEGAVFDALIRAGRFELLEEVGRQYFPASAIMQLPWEIVSRAFGVLNVHERTGLLLTMNERQRFIFLATLSPAAKDYFDHELRTYELNPSIKIEVDKNAGSYWKTLVDVVRQLLRSNEDLAAQAEPILQRWLAEKKRARHAS